jgi:hypothetical protein
MKSPRSRVHLNDGQEQRLRFIKRTRTDPEKEQNEKDGTDDNHFEVKAVIDELALS